MGGSTGSPASEPGDRGGTEWSRERTTGEPEEPHTAPAEAWNRYHCPVCSHQDRVTLRGARARIRCSHCDTPLEVRLPTPTSERVSVRVALDATEE